MPRSARKITQKRIKLALRVVAPGCEVYAPIFERLESELEAMHRVDDVKAQAHALQSNSPSTRCSEPA